ncbi:MAG: MFS transporter [Actinomycetes bacterium]
MRSPLPAYLTLATLARSATESTGPATLIVAISTIGSAASGSYVVASLTGAAAVGGPVLGAVIDRSKHPRGVFALAITLLTCGLIAIDVTMGRLPLAVVMVIAVVAGFGYPALTGAWTAQLPRLIEPARLRHALSFDATTYSIAAVAAPPIASALVVINGRAPLWLPVVLLLVSLCLLPIVALRPAHPHGTSRSLRHDLLDGTTALTHIPALRRTTIITVVGFAGTAPFFIAAPVIAQHLTGSLGVTGVILGVFACGGVLAALWCTRFPVKRPDRAIITLTLISAFLLLGIGLSPTLPSVLFFSFFMGAAESPLLSSMFQVRNRESPAHVQSQVFTTSASLRMTSFALVSALSGWLLHFGYEVAIALGVGLHLLSVLIGVLLGPRLPHHRHWWRRP